MEKVGWYHIITHTDRTNKSVTYINEVKQTLWLRILSKISKRMWIWAINRRTRDLNG